MPHEDGNGGFSAIVCIVINRQHLRCCDLRKAVLLPRQRSGFWANQPKQWWPVGGKGKADLPKAEGLCEQRRGKFLRPVVLTDCA